MVLLNASQCNSSFISIPENFSTIETLFVRDCIGINECVPLDTCRLFIANYVWPNPVEWVVIFIYVVVFIVGIVGNGLVCLVVSRTIHMRTITNIFIVNLAVADFLVILICLPPSVLADTTESWYLGNIMCKLVSCLQTVSVSVSVLTLSAIAIERYFAICHPLRRRLNNVTVAVIITVIWVSSCLVALPELLYQELQKSYSEEVTTFLQYCELNILLESKKLYQIILMVGLYVFPMCVMLFAYVTISIRLWRDSFHQDPDRRRHFSAARPDHQLYVRRKAARMLMTIVILFALCYLPIHVFNIIIYNVNLSTMESKFLVIYALTSRGLCYVNCAINPIIYNFMSAKFRQEFKAAFSMCRSDPAKVPVNKFRATRTNGQTRSDRMELMSMNTTTSRSLNQMARLS